MYILARIWKCCCLKSSVGGHPCPPRCTGHIPSERNGSFEGAKGPFADWGGRTCTGDFFITKTSGSIDSQMSNTLTSRQVGCSRTRFYGCSWPQMAGSRDRKKLEDWRPRPQSCHLPGLEELPNRIWEDYIMLTNIFSKTLIWLWFWFWFRIGLDLKGRSPQRSPLKHL